MSSYIHKQHTVSEFLVKMHEANGNFYSLNIIESKKQSKLIINKSHSKNSLVVPHYYELDVAKTNEIEDWISKNIESPFSSSVKFVANQGANNKYWVDLTKIQLEEIYRYLYCLSFRTPKGSDLLWRDMNDLMNNKNFVDYLLTNYRPLNDPETSFSRRLQTQKIFGYKNKKSTQIQYIKNSLNVNIPFNSDWHIYKSNGLFLLGEHPACWLVDPAGNRSLATILSHSIVLVISIDSPSQFHSVKSLDIIQAKKSDIDFLNKLQLEMSMERIYSGRKDLLNGFYKNFMSN